MLRGGGPYEGLTAQRHARDVSPLPAEVVHQRPDIRSHDPRLVRGQVLRDAAAADAPVVKCAAPAA